MAGLDGLRAVAVLAVMAFHAGIGGAGGGLLGVDVFFVISGFLVTSLLIREQTATGAIALGRFWARRARRLVPALLVLLAGISVYARWQGSGLSPIQVRGDALATLLYGANWHYVLSGQNYFVRFGAPSPLLHTWSLAVEEQFYLVWPVVALLVLKRYGRRGLGWTAAAAALASAGWCAASYLTGASVSRLYYGTDTRAQALMIGAGLAVVLFRPGMAVRSSGPRRGVVGLAGVGGAVVLGYLLHRAQGNGPFLYEGGFALVGLAAAGLVTLTVLEPGHPLSRALSWGPLRYVGRISYGLYLYHWPLFQVLTEARTGLRGIELLGLRFAATFALAAASFHLIEDPVRTGRGWPARLADRIRVGRLRSVVSVRTAGAVAAAGVVGALATVSVPAAPVLTAADLSQPAPDGAVGAGAPGPPAAAGAPVHAVLIGDSMALTLGAGLGVDAPRWGVALQNGGVLGCDLDPGTTVRIMGTVSPAAQGCPDWQAAWANLVQRTNPDVVVVLLGRWETIDRLYGGRWTTVGDAAFDRHLQSELTRIVQIGSARGARVVFLTLPYIAQTTEQPNGAPWDMNLPSRTDAYNADVRAVVARYPGESSVIDLNRILDPGGRYTSVIDNVRVRDYDDEHLSVVGGEWLRGRILPELASLGISHRDAAPIPSGPAGGNA